MWLKYISKKRNLVIFGIPLKMKIQDPHTSNCIIHAPMPKNHIFETPPIQKSIFETSSYKKWYFLSQTTTGQTLPHYTKNNTIFAKYYLVKNSQNGGKLPKFDPQSQVHSVAFDLIRTW